MARKTRAGRKPMSKQKKIVAASLSVAIAATAVFGGALASFTDRDTTATQTLQAGTVDIAVEDDLENVSFSQPIKPMAPGDTWTRYVNVRNKGNLTVNPMTLSQANEGGLVIDGDYGVDVTVEACSTAWVDKQCGGTSYANALPSVQLRGWQTAAPLNIPQLAPAEALYFKFTTHLPSEAPNDYQASESKVRYTFDAIQRNGVQNVNGAVIPVANPQPVEAVDLSAALNSTGDSVSLQWQGTGAKTYMVQRTTDPASNQWKIVSVGEDTTVTDASVLPDTIYYYRAISLGEGFENRATSNTASVHTWMENVKPVLVASSPTPTTVPLSWTLPKGVKTLRLEQSSTPTFADAVSRTLAADARSFTVSGLDNASTYYFKLVAMGEGLTLESSAVEVKTKLPTLNLTAARSTDQIALTWNELGANTVYTLKQGDAVLYTGPATSFTHAGLAAGTAYSYTLTAERNGVEAEPRRASFSTTVGESGEEASAPLPANTLRIESVKSSSVNLAWLRVSGASGYKLERSPTVDFATPQEVYRGNANAFADTELPSHSTWYYRLTAIAAASQVERTTAPVKAVTLPEAVTLSAVKSSPTAVDLGWSSLDEAGVQYTVQQSRSATTGFATIATTDKLSHTVDSLAPGRYYFRVVAVASDGLSSVSGLATVDLTGLEAPAIVGVTQQGGQANITTTTIEFSRVEGASRYLVQTRLANGTWRTSGAGSTTVPQFAEATNKTVLQLEPSSMLEARVIAVSSTAEEATSETSAFLTRMYFSNRGVKVTRTPADRLTIAVDALPAGYTYRLAYGTDKADLPIIYSGEDLTRTVDFLDRDAAAHHVVVTLVDAHGQAGTSANLQNSQSTPPAPVSGITATPVDSTTTTVSWDRVASVTSYAVLDGSSPLCTTAGNACTITLAKGKRYDNLSVVAYRSNPDLATASSIPAPFAATTAVGATTLSATSAAAEITLTWDSVANANNYTLQRSATSDFSSPTSLYSGTARTYSDATARPGTAYYYRVLTTGENATVTASTPLLAALKSEQVVATFTKRTPTTLTVQWNAIAGATRYVVNYSLSPSMSSPTSVNAATPEIELQGLSSATTYYVTVAALDDTNASVGTTSEVISKLTEAPPVQLTLDGTDFAAGSISLAVPARSGTFAIEESIDGGAYKNVATFTGSSNSRTVTVLTGRTADYTYTYRAYLIAQGEKLGESAPVEAKLTPAAVPPSATENGRAVTLSWPVKPSGANQFDIYRRSGSSSLEKIGTTTGLSYTDTTVTSATNYSYTVDSVAKNGTTASSSPLAVAVSHAPPTFNSVTLVDPYTSTLSWADDSTCSSGTQVYRSTSANGAGTLIATGTFTSYTDTTLEPNTTYYYYLRVRCSTFNAAKSATLSVTSPLAPVDITSTSAISTTGFTVNWKRTNVNGYVVQYSKTSNFSSPVTVASSYPGNSTSYTFSGLEAGETYYVRLTSYTDTQSVVSTPYRVVTALSAKAVPTFDYAAPAETAATSTIRGTWPAVPGAATYRMEISSSSAFTTLVDTVTTTTNSATSAQKLTADSAYFVRVISLGESGGESTSDTISARSAPLTIKINGLASDGDTTSGYGVRISASNAASSGTPQIRVAKKQEDLATSPVFGGVPLSASASVLLSNVLEPDTVYYVAGTRTWGSTRVVVSDVKLYKTAKTSLTMTALYNGSGQNISWAPVEGATSYKLYRTATSISNPGSPSAAIAQTPIYTGVNTSYVDTLASSYNASSDSAYNYFTYVVVATLSDGSNSQAASTVVADNVRTNFKASVTASSAASIGLSWPAVPNATSYYVRCANSSIAAGATTNTFNSTNATYRMTVTGTTATFVRNSSSSTVPTMCAVEALNGSTRIGFTSSVSVHN